VNADHKILRGWKAIARRLGVSVRAAQERERRGLPVHREFGGGTVYVFEQDIEVWLNELARVRHTSAK